MAYTINKTDGSILATVADGQIDQLSTDITLIGKNYSGFGESLNENFVKLLENFADTTEPQQPIKGQIWFDSSELKLKVYTGTSFQPVSSATISSSQPDNLGVGDLWFNDVDRQLYFFDGTTTILLAPLYSASQGVSGIKVVTVLDSLNQNRVITQLYNNGVLLGIFSKDTFDPKLPIDGFSGTIYAGFSVGSLSGLKFNVTATNADSLGNQPASRYLRTDTDNIIDGQLTILSNRGILIGQSQEAQIIVNNGDVQIQNDFEDKDITVKVKRGAAVDTVIEIDTTAQLLSLYGDNPDSETYIGGALVIEGDLTVRGDTTTVNTSVLTVEDKNIELAKITSPTDSYADGGGMIVKGASDKLFVWKETEAGPSYSATDIWYSTENLLLETAKGLYIKDGLGNPRLIIDATSLGPTITSIPGVTSFGAQTEITVDDLYFNDNIIQVTPSDTDLILDIDGTGTLNLQGKKISSVQDPTDPQDAATKEYVDNSLETRSLVFSMDVSDAISNAGIASWLTQVAPPSEFRNGTLARILCTSLSNGTTSLNLNSYLYTGPGSTAEFITPDAPASIVPGGTGNAYTNISFSTATVSAPVISVFRVVKTFQLVAGAWSFLS
jgi:hypothetical protein